MAGGKQCVSFQMCFADREISASGSLPIEPVTLPGMLPVFQGVAKAIVELAQARAADAGVAVTCRKRCAQCCRQLVPIAKPEAGNLVDLVAAMPPERRSRVINRFATAVQRAGEAGLGETMRSAEHLNAEQHYALSYDYIDLQIACPFLEDEMCSIYENRPLQCREHLVLTPPENCRRPRPETVRALPLPARPSKALFQMEPDGPHWMPLVLALEWAGANAARQPSAAPGPEILRRFLDVLQTTSP